MKTSIRDAELLRAVPPPTLSAFARSMGWKRGKTYRSVSNIYTGPQLPEVIIPNTNKIGDYASVVSRLIEIFARVSKRDELALYRELMTADCDKVQIRVVDRDDDGSLPLETGREIINSARDIVLAAACSIGKSQPVYRPGSNKDAIDYVKRMRLGQTGHGSFVIMFLGPPFEGPYQPSLGLDSAEESKHDPMERKVTKRLNQALNSVRAAIDHARKESGDLGAFTASAQSGVSANLCDALAKLTDHLVQLTITVSWAPTFPVGVKQTPVRFASEDSSILMSAGREFRRREDPPAKQVFTGYVQQLKRNEESTEGTVTLRTSIQESKRSIAAELQEDAYLRAVEAHSAKKSISIEGDLDRSGNHSRLKSAKIVD